MNWEELLERQRELMFTPTNWGLDRTEGDVFQMPTLMDDEAMTTQELAQQILDLAQSALITGRTWPEVDRMHNLIEALEDITKLCQEQQKKGKSESRGEV